MTQVSALNHTPSPGDASAGHVSVIMAAYNGAATINEAAESVLAQSYPNLELIIVDDASTDNTLAELGRWGDRIRLLRQERNGGQAAARNAGLRASTGEFVSFLDQDDLYLPTRLETAVRFLQEHPAFGAVYTDCRHTGPEGKLPARAC